MNLPPTSSLPLTTPDNTRRDHALDYPTYHTCRTIVIICGHVNLLEMVAPSCEAAASSKTLFFTQLRHTPPTPAYDGKHPQLCIRAEDDQQERDGFLCCDAPVRVCVGHPEEGDVEDDEDTSESYCGDREKCKARQDGSFGCLES